MRPLTDDERTMVEANRGLVWYVISRFGYPRKLHDELESAGYIGLFRAVQLYNPEQGKLSTFALPWIRGYICTELRKLKSNAIYASMNWDDRKEEVAEIIDPAAAVSEKDERLPTILHAIEGLKPIEQAVVRSHVMDGKPSPDVGRELHMTKWAVLQIKMRAIRKLRKQLRLQGVDFSAPE